MLSRLSRYLGLCLKTLKLTVLLRQTAFLPQNSFRFPIRGLIGSRRSAAWQKRILESSVKQHVPIKIKIKKDKEESFKDLKNKQWVRDFELEITNTSDKPIYYISFDLVTDVKTQGTPLIFSLQYGRLELADLSTRARSDDVPIKPKETYLFKLHQGQIPAWEQSVSEGRHADATKLLLALQEINFGDGTGYLGNTPYPLQAPSGVAKVRPNGSAQTKPVGRSAS
jgi:hypothetical protein